jgi:hypothetical protein
MLYRELITVFFCDPTNLINTLCGQNVEFLIFNLEVLIVTTVL